MNQIKPNLPKEFSYYTFLPIRITDINYGGHVGNDTVLTLFHEARMQFLKHHSFSEMDFGGVALIMRSVIIEFKKEIFYGDTLKVYVALANFNRIGFDVCYKMVKDAEEIIVAEGKTGMICYDYKLKKIMNVPEIIHQKIK